MNFLSQYPQTRLRRLRKNSNVRALVQENHLSVDDLILPLFVADKTESIPAMSGIKRFSIDDLLKHVEQVLKAGIKAIALFPAENHKHKNNLGSHALDPNNLVNSAITALKKDYPNLLIIADVALDPYTIHGHDGLLDHSGQVDNDATIAVLSEQALLLANVGADIIAPSDMQDGRIGLIRQTLELNGHHHALILSYAAKYASEFYGPFRNAVGSASNPMGFKDKRHYQQNPANAHEALHEVAQDIKEGADMIMIKPGLPYLDVIHAVKTTFQVPTFAYQVSGEYSMLKLAIDQGILAQQSILESLLCFKRAGADCILSYFALEAAQLLS